MNGKPGTIGWWKNQMSSIIKENLREDIKKEDLRWPTK